MAGWSKFTWTPGFVVYDHPTIMWDTAVTACAAIKILSAMHEDICMRAEISYDLVMDDDVEFVEGTYRLPGGGWQVVIFSAFERDVTDPEVIPQVWASGVTGVFVRFPRSERINRAAVQRVLSAAFGVSEWVEVRGPDSMQLRS